MNDIEPENSDWLGEVYKGVLGARLRKALGIANSIDEKTLAQDESDLRETLLRYQPQADDKATDSVA